MSRRKASNVLVGLFLLGAAIGPIYPSSAAVAQARHRSPCSPHGSETIVEDESVRVYKLPLYIEGVPTKRPGTYACRLRRGTPLALEPSRSGPPFDELRRFTLAGTMLAYEDFQHSVDAGCSSITVVDVAKGETVLNVGHVGCSVDGGFVGSDAPTDLVVNEHGTVAWIVVRTGFGHPSKSVEVHSATVSGSATLLDSDTNIVPESLRLAPGGEVRWLDGQGARYAVLD